jgi:UDP-hydrolysing UDP-N-acetyl-D-glucosamine 2-epimerase
MLHVAVVTGSRADYGPLRPLLLALQRDTRFEFSLIVCAVGGRAEGDRQLDAVEEDGLPPAEVVRADPDSVPPPTTQAARALEGVAAALERIGPDLVVVLGDRFEILAASFAAHLLRVPIVHLSGGDETLGSLDDAMRHAISRLASLHFPTNDESARRLRNLGIPADRITVAGSTALDDLLAFEPMGRDDLARSLGIPIEVAHPIVVVTYHAATAADEPPAATFFAIVDAVREVVPTAVVIVTGSNSDEGGRQIDAAAAERAAEDPRLHVVPSLGTRRYWSLLQHAAAVIGNSSSALIEAPLIGVPVVDVGERQASRLRVQSCIHARPDQASIADAIRRSLGRDRLVEASPYGDGHAVPRILDRLASISDPAELPVPVPLSPARIQDR